MKGFIMLLQETGWSGVWSARELIAVMLRGENAWSFCATPSLDGSVFSPSEGNVKAALLLC